MLDPVQNQALKLCMGAFRTSPVDSLQVEANEPPLDRRRNRLAIQYVTKLKSNPSNPTYQCVFTPQFTRLVEEKHDCTFWCTHGRLDFEDAAYHYCCCCL